MTLHRDSHRPLHQTDVLADCFTNFDSWICTDIEVLQCPEQAQHKQDIAGWQHIWMMCTLCMLPNRLRTQAPQAKEVVNCQDKWFMPSQMVRAMWPWKLPVILLTMLSTMQSMTSPTEQYTLSLHHKHGIHHAV